MSETGASSTVTMWAAGSMLSRPTVSGAVPGAGRVRRSTARTRAISSRGENGLTT